MFAARALARSAPRAINRSVRLSTSTFASTILRAQRVPVRSQISAFSTSLLRQSAASNVDAELSAKLGAEMEFETGVKEGESMPVSVKDFLENGPFDIKDTPGMQDVVLTRTYGNEKITVTFSISDIADMGENMMEDDEAMTDEDGELMNENESQGGAEDGEDGAGGAEPGLTCRLNVVVEKPGQGALNIEAMVQDAAIIVENMYYYQDPAIAHSATPEAVHKERDVYPGPPFGTLDEDLQLLMEQYLDERGINTALAVFVPDYMDVKEHKEYLTWLSNVKKFIEA